LNSQPAVSLVIPTYNRALLIVQTVQAALDQTVPFAEIIVVDDASPDDTLVQLRQFGDRIKIIASKKIGVQAARNLGVSTATSEYITLCDSDDLLLPDFLSKIGGYLSTHPKIDSLYSNYQSFTDSKVEGDILSGAPKGFFDHACFEGDFVTDIPDLYTKSIVFQPMIMTGATIKKDFYMEIGGFDPVFDGVPSEDWEYTLRVVASGKIAFCMIALVRIRRHAGNDSRDILRVRLGEVEVMKFALKHHAFAQRYREVLQEAIRKRYSQVFYESFRAREFAIAGAVLPLLENRPMTFRFWFKSLFIHAYSTFKRCELCNILQLPRDKAVITSSSLSSSSYPSKAQS
jgi:glycosyltransferase involved in cell wall biosynthesis